MSTTDFIKLKINDLLKYNSVESVKYGISKWTGAHIIEISPVHVFKSEEFLDIEALDIPAMLTPSSGDVDPLQG